MYKVIIGIKHCVWEKQADQRLNDQFIKVNSKKGNIAGITCKIWELQMIITSLHNLEVASIHFKLINLKF